MQGDVDLLFEKVERDLNSRVGMARVIGLLLRKDEAKGCFIWNTSPWSAMRHGVSERQFFCLKTMGKCCLRLLLRLLILRIWEDGRLLWAGGRRLYGYVSEAFIGADSPLMINRDYIIVI
jgi:hypothetical protein